MTAPSPTTDRPEKPYDVIVATMQRTVLDHSDGPSFEAAMRHVHAHRAALAPERNTEQAGASA